MRHTLTVVLALMLALGISPAKAQAVFEPGATGADFMRAAPRDQGLLLLILMRRLHPGADESTHIVEAAKLGVCLKESMTPRDSKEKSAALLLRDQKLADLLALCTILER